MQNKQKSTIFFLVAGIILLTATGFFIKYELSGPIKSTLDASQSQVGIKEDIFNKIATPKDFGQSLSPNETGFGRPDPFASYK